MSSVCMWKSWSSWFSQVSTVTKVPGADADSYSLNSMHPRWPWVAAANLASASRMISSDPGFVVELGDHAQLRHGHSFEAGMQTCHTLAAMLPRG